MPKIKTRRGTAKRFKITGSGKVLRRKAGHSHILTKKRPGRKRNLNESALVFKGEAKSIKRLLPYN